MLKSLFFNLSLLAWVVSGLLGLFVVFAGPFLLGLALLLAAWGFFRLAVKCDPQPRAHV